MWFLKETKLVFSNGSKKNTFRKLQIKTYLFMKKLLFTGFFIALVSSGLSFMVYKTYFHQQETIVRTSHITPSQLVSNPSSMLSSAGRPDFTAIAAKAVDAVVNVKNYSSKLTTLEYTDPFEFFFDFPQNPKRSQPQADQNVPTGHGSGVIISPNGYIVTNNHVIDEADKIEITLNNQKTYKAKVIGNDPNSDVALLKIEAENLSFLNFADSEKVQVGEWVLAIGNPFSLNSTVTAGIVSAKGRSLDILRSRSAYAIESFIQTDAAINPGNSGGPLVNTNGDLIGINTAIASKSGSYVGYGFAVPSNLVRKVIEDLKKYGVVQRAFIGIQSLDLSNEESLLMYNQKYKTKLKSQQGVMVLEVIKDTGAAQAGIKEKDIIKRVDERIIRNYADLIAIIGSKRPGDKIKIDVLRDKQQLSFVVTLKDNEGTTRVRTRQESASDLLGVKLTPLEDAVKFKLGITYGVRISQLNGGYLAAIGMKKGDVILSVNHRKIKKSSDIDLSLLKKYNGDVFIKWLDQYGTAHIRGFELN